MTITPYSTATEIASEVALGTTTSRAACDMYLNRIAAKNPQLRAIMALRSTTLVHADADAADARAASGSLLSPLDGVPFTAKMIWETENLQTSTGTAAVNYLPPTGYDADVIAKLRAAGCVLLGKANAPGNPVHTASPLFAEAKNPYNTGRATGGSSGGSSAAVAAGFTGFDIGQDAAGSIRIPASWNGVYGLKASTDVISNVGDIWPTTPDRPPLTFQDHILGYGPIARSIDDVAAILDLIVGPSTRQPNVVPIYEATAPTLRKVVRIKTIGIWTLSSWINTAIDALCNTLTANGVTVVTQNISFFNESIMNAVGNAINGTPGGVLNTYYPAIHTNIRPWNPSGLPWSGTAGYLPNFLSGQVYAQYLRQQLYNLMSDADVFITGSVPISPNVVGGVEYTFVPHLAFTYLFNFTGNPSITMPLGVDPLTKCPFGLQVIGRHYRDRDLLYFAKQINQYLTGFVPPAAFP